MPLGRATSPPFGRKAATVINDAGHTVMTDMERAEKLLVAAIRHGKAFKTDILASRLTKDQQAALPAANVFHMKRHQGGNHEQ